MDALLSLQSPREEGHLRKAQVLESMHIHRECIHLYLGRSHFFHHSFDPRHRIWCHLQRWDRSPLQLDRKYCLRVAVDYPNNLLLGASHFLGLQQLEDQSIRWGQIHLHLGRSHLHHHNFDRHRRTKSLRFLD